MKNQTQVAPEKRSPLFRDLHPKESEKPPRMEDNEKENFVVAVQLEEEKVLRKKASASDLCESKKRMHSR